MSALIFVPNQRVNTTFGTNYCVPPKSWLDEQLMFIKQGFGVGYCGKAPLYRIPV